MDVERFDALVKSAARSTSRRGLLRVLLGGIVGSFFAKQSTAEAALEFKSLADPPELECPKCGKCLFCDPNSADGDCVPCTDDDKCLTATLCAEANNDPFNIRLRTNLENRGFVQDGNPETVVIVAGGTPTGTRSSLGIHYKHSKRESEEAYLYFLPWPEVGGDSMATVLRKGEPLFGLVVEDDLTVTKVEPPADTGENARALVAFNQVSAECRKCYELCDTLNGAVGNGVVCTLVGTAACARAGAGPASLLCGIAAAVVCNSGSAECSDVICTAMQGCPPLCDPTCESTDPDTGKCTDICKKTNSMCVRRACICKYVECGDECCNQGKVCKESQCVDDCGPCWFPNNEGQCFDLCASSTPNQEAGECCVSEDNPRGLCCFSSERCCDGVCLNAAIPCCSDPGVFCCPPDHPFPHLLEPYCCSKASVSFPVESGQVDCVPRPGP